VPRSPRSPKATRVCAPPFLPDSGLLRGVSSTIAPTHRRVLIRSAGAVSYSSLTRHSALSRYLLLLTFLHPLASAWPSPAAGVEGSSSALQMTPFFHRRPAISLMLSCQPSQSLLLCPITITAATAHLLSGLLLRQSRRYGHNYACPDAADD
jgi:hypothetical protein